LDVYEDGLTSSDYTFVYIHGGYWQELNKDISAYCVEPLVNAGIRVVIPGYDLAPKGTFYYAFIYVRYIKKKVGKMVTSLL